jgi:hypothetical protein
MANGPAPIEGPRPGQPAAGRTDTREFNPRTQGLIRAKLSRQSTIRATKGPYIPSAERPWKKTDIIQTPSAESQSIEQPRLEPEIPTEAELPATTVITETSAATTKESPIAAAARKAGEEYRSNPGLVADSQPSPLKGEPRPIPQPEQSPFMVDPANPRLGPKNAAPALEAAAAQLKEAAGNTLRTPPPFITEMADATKGLRINYQGPEGDTRTVAEKAAQLETARRRIAHSREPKPTRPSFIKAATAAFKSIVTRLSGHNEPAATQSGSN